MDSFNKFSVINSKVQLITQNGKKRIVKKISQNIDLGMDLLDLQKYLLQYAKVIKNSGIPSPTIRSYKLKKPYLIFVCDYKGVNILEKSKNEINFLCNKKKIFAQIVNILRLVQKNNIFFDPHIKNFVIEKGKVYYVDFSPPYTKGYMNLRIKKSRIYDKELIKKSFNAFSPKEIGYHFAADLLKLDCSYHQILQFLYKSFLKHQIVSGSFKKFKKKAEAIKFLEEKRMREDIYLM